MLKIFFVGVFVFSASDALAHPSKRISCWQIKAQLLLHGIDPRDRVAARNAARARGYSEAEIAEAERRCWR